MKRIVIILLIFIAVRLVPAQHILVSDSAFGRPNDTVVLCMEIENSTPFISFQFDIQLPSGSSFAANSLKLTARSTNHVVIGTPMGNDAIRILAYSPNNAAFTGNAGKVLTFKLVLGNIKGEFPLTLSNAVIGDSLSTNILSGSQSGILSVFPLEIDEYHYSNTLLHPIISPNPVRENSVLEFSLKDLSQLEMTLLDPQGKSLWHFNSGELGEGRHKFLLPGTLYTSMLPGILYLVRYKVQQRGQVPCFVSQKIVK